MRILVRFHSSERITEKYLQNLASLISSAVAVGEDHTQVHVNHALKGMTFLSNKASHQVRVMLGIES